MKITTIFRVAIATTITAGLLGVTQFNAGTVRATSTPTNSAPPTIPAPRAYLPNTATAGTWSSGTLSYQWEKSNDLTTWTNATGTGATSLTYTPTQSDAGNYLRLKETATLGTDIASAYSIAQVVSPPDFLYVNNLRTSPFLSVLPIDPSTGILGPAYVSAHTTAAVLGFTVSARGDIAWATDANNTIRTYRIEPSGVLTALNVTNRTAAGARVGVATRDGRFVYFAERDGSLIRKFSVSSNGELVPLSVPSISFGDGGTPVAEKILLSNDGQFLYAVNRFGQTRVQVYRVGTDGLLTRVASYRADGNVAPWGEVTNATLTPDGRFFYVTQWTWKANGTTRQSNDDSSGSVYGYSVNQADGTLTPFPNQGQIGIPSRTAQDVVATNTHVYVGSSYDATIQSFAIGQDGTLTSLNISSQILDRNGCAFVMSCIGWLTRHPQHDVVYIGDTGPRRDQMFQGTMSGVFALGSPQSVTAGPLGGSDISHLNQWVVQPKPQVLRLVPHATSFSSPQSTINYTLDFRVPIDPSTLTASDFVVSGSATGWTITSISGQGAGPYIVTLANGGSGTVDLRLGTQSVTGTNTYTGPVTNADALTVTITGSSTSPSGATPTTTTVATTTTTTTVATTTTSTDSTMPDLVSTSDTGLSDSDNVTADNTPKIQVPGTFTTGSTVTVMASRSGYENVTCNYVVPATECNLGLLADGPWSITASIVHPTNGSSTTTEALAIVVDTRAPSATATPDLLASSDSGISDTDNRTSDKTPSFTATGGPNNARVTLAASKGTKRVSCSYVRPKSRCRMPNMETGSWQVTARLTDLAGNRSPSSSSLTVIIEEATSTLPKTGNDLQNIVNLAGVALLAGGFMILWRRHRVRLA